MRRAAFRAQRTATTALRCPDRLATAGPQVFTLLPGCCYDSCQRAQQPAVLALCMRGRVTPSWTAIVIPPSTVLGSPTERSLSVLVLL